MLKSILKRFKRPGHGGRSAPRPFRYAILEHASGARTFVKTYPNHARLEFTRGQALHDAAVRSGSFVAPRPLELVESQHIIIWEHLEGLTELREFLVEDIRRFPDRSQSRARLFFEAGRALAILHQSLLPTASQEEFNPL